eukprot:1273354-Rhodomonas_salina.2
MQETAISARFVPGVQCKKPQFRRALYQECGFLSLVSGCRRGAKSKSTVHSLGPACMNTGSRAGCRRLRGHVPQAAWSRAFRLFLSRNSCTNSETAQRSPRAQSSSEQFWDLFKAILRFASSTS